MRLPHLALLALLLLPTSSPADPARIDAIDQHLQRLKKLGFAGVVLVAQGDETLLASGYGLAGREADRPWTPGTVSTIGSITKQFTGAAILALAEEGQLSVDDTLSVHFAGVPADKRAITLHQLLTHSSGIVDVQGIGDFDPVGREEFVRRALAQELAFPPGEGYAYSNAGYSLLGAIVEQRTGSNYEQFVRERFFLPAGMQDTGYILPGFPPERVARGYRDGEEWGSVLERPMADDGPYWVLRANGGIHSTAEDMARWARHLLAGRALSPASMEQYWAPHVDEGGGDSHYGYGWVVMELAGTEVITHNGGNGIHFADMAILPDPGLVIFLQCNVAADFPVAEGLLRTIGRHLLAGEPLPSVPDRVEREPAALARNTGRYELPGGGTVVVELGDGGLGLSAQDPTAFTRLLSTRPGDPERARGLSARMDEIFGAWLAGDVEPLWHAYGQRVSQERLRESRDRTLKEWAQEHGEPVGHRILGTAFRDDGDATLVRVRFEHGHVDRHYAWDPDAEASLLGVAYPALDPVLHAVPDAGGDFATWDPNSGSSVPLRFGRADDGAQWMELGGWGERARRAGEG